MSPIHLFRAIFLIKKGNFRKVVETTMLHTHSTVCRRHFVLIARHQMNANNHIAPNSMSSDSVGRLFDARHTRRTETSEEGKFMRIIYLIVSCPIRKFKFKSLSTFFTFLFSSFRYYVRKRPFPKSVPFAKSR